MTAQTADGAGQAGPHDERWEPGTQVLWRYRANGAHYPHICRPVTVVTDTPELLAVWVAPGTTCVKPELADGTPVHREPLATRYTKPRTTARSEWFGTGVLKLARPGEPWSVWLFWERGWRFKNWYVNLEEPRRRWRGGLDSEDHFLDIVVHPDRSWEMRDEDEFAAAQRAGLMAPDLAAAVRSRAGAAVERIERWAAPFCDGWEEWRPDPAWPVPRLPAGWAGTEPDLLPPPVPPARTSRTSVPEAGNTRSRTHGSGQLPPPGSGQPAARSAGQGAARPGRAGG